MLTRKKLLKIVLAFLPVAFCYSFTGESLQDYNGGIKDIRIDQTDPEYLREHFNHANDLYVNGEFEEAADVYETIISTGYYSAEIYYNLGNAYYRSNKIPSAILNYERAALFVPGDEDITFNLELAKMRTRDRMEELPEFFLSSWWKSGRNLLGVGQWATISVVTFIVFLIFLSGFLVSPLILVKKFFFWSGALLFLLSVLSFSFGLDQRNYIKNHNKAIVFSPVLPVKSSPDINSADLFIIHEGTKVRVEDSISNWRAVRLSDGNKGWVPEDAIEMI